jgi:hypothetical protein
MFAGLVVLVSDDHVVTAGSNSSKYTSILYGRGAIAETDHLPVEAVETERKESSGNGGGQDILHNRRHTLIHPRGFKWLAASVAGKSPLWSEVVDAANWDRVRERKNIRIAFLESN